MLRTLLLALACASAVLSQQALPLSIIVSASETEARQILSRLRAGADFGTLAKESSVDPSASDGGYLGLTDPSKLRPELKDAASGLKAGEVSGVIRIPSGYAVLKLVRAATPVADTAPSVRNQSLSSAGAVRLTYDYAGFASVLQAVNRLEKPEGWQRDLKSACEVRTAAVPAAVRQIETLLQRPDASPSFLRDVNSLLGDLHSSSGELEEALQTRQAAYKIALESSPERVPEIEESIGVTYLQRAGLTLYKDFTFPQPLRATLTRAQKDDLTAAADYFSRHLKHVPADGEVGWLLNLTFMLLGQYPAGVPRDHLVAPAVFQSLENVVRFHDVAQAAGLSRTRQAGGLIIDDFDNDGLLDVVMSSVNDCDAIALYHNNGDGTFTDRSQQAGLSTQTGGLNILQADYNNDGCLDILVLRGGWEYGRRKSLLRNNCDGTFTDVTEESGLGDTITATQTAVWADIDNDGSLDLFIGNENAPAQLFLNRRDGAFVEIAKAAGVDSAGFTKGVVAADYDNDGYADLYVSALNGQHHLYHNNHDKTFTDTTRLAGVEGPWTTFGALFFDYDNDGWQDLLVAGYGGSVEDVMKGYMQQPQGGETLRLFRNLGNGKFGDFTADVGLKKVFMPMGLNAGDMDNDGYPDFYLGSGNPSYASPIPNALFHNRAGKSFTDVTASSGTGVLPKGHGIAFADLDNDGDEDLVVVMGGAVLGDRQTARLFENPGVGNDWLSVRLVGVKSNRSAIGARIKVTVRDSSGMLRTVHKTVGSGGSFGAGPLEQHIGIGKAARVESVEIWWPASGTAQSFRDIEKNRRIEIQESGQVRILNTQSFKLGKAGSKQ